MKKPTILLVSPYRGFRTTYAGILSESFHVVVRENLPAVDDFIVRRVGLILIINQWERIPDYAIHDLAESVKIPVVVMVDAGHSNIMHYAQRSLYLTVLVNPVTNEQLIAAVQKALNETQSPGKKERQERDKSAEKAFKSAYKSSAFRRKIEKIIDFIQNNYAEVNNFQKLAESFDVNYESMRRAIEYKTGKTPQDYLREIRMEKMLQLIQFAHLNTEEICMEVGLNDVSHVRKLFQERFGLTIEECIAQFRCTGKTV